jgi:hypothetical protein
MCPFDFVDRAHRRGDYRVPAGSGRRGIGRRTSPPRSLGIRAFRDVAAGGLKARAVVRAGDGETTSSPLGGDVRFVVRGCDSGGALTALEVINPPGQGPPLHVHTAQDETIHVLDGELRWPLGEEVLSAGPGA